MKKSQSLKPLSLPNTVLVNVYEAYCDIDPFTTASVRSAALSLADYFSGTLAEDDRWLDCYLTPVVTTTL